MLKTDVDCQIGRHRRGAMDMFETLRGFRRNEDGAMVIFSIFMFICMILVAGIGIDLMRYERDRSKLQSTLDRAVLAASDLDQTLSAEAVVQDYFDKAGIGEYLTSVTVDEGIGYRSVSANAKSTINTMFLKMLGYEQLTAPASGTAEERIDNIEISLILDVSGSMGSNSRLDRLKPAAIEFVDTILDTSTDGGAVISVIPYATQVNAGESLLNGYTVTDEHNYSHCVNFNDDQYRQLGLSTTETLERTAHFDPFTNFNPNDQPANSITSPVCPVLDYSEILPLTDDRTALHNHINALQAWGYTSIDIGLKWGSSLLDPSAQPAVSSLIQDGVVDAKFEGLPVSYDSTTLKIIVLMTDGENTNQYMLNPSMRDGLSDVWYTAPEGRQTDHIFSVERSNGHNTQYWWPHEGAWFDEPYQDGAEYEVCTTSGWGWWSWRSCETKTAVGTAVRLTYPELFNMVSLATNAGYLHSFQGNRWSAWYHNAFTHKNGTAKDQRTKHACKAAKDAGIVIFTIGFEAPTQGQSLLESCASSDSHHFDVDGLDIADAFSAIASSISKLKLSQ